ncbi:MAG: acyltransferase family protein, partial [Terriglobus sp.]
IVVLIFAGRVLLSPRYPALTAAFLTIYVNSPDRDFWVLEHTWSLCVEEQFYLIWPFALVWALQARDAALRRQRSIRIAIFSIIAIVVIRIPWAAIKPYTQFHLLGNAILQSDVIFFGALAAVAEGGDTFERWYRRATARPWVLFVLLFGVSSALNNLFIGKYMSSIGSTVDGLLIMWLLLWTIREPQTRFGRFLNWKPVARIGVLSYSLYLWQTFFLHYHSELVLGASRHLPIPLAIVLIVAAGTASFYLVEQPVLRLRDHLFQRWKTS